jgi:predicted transcriptional regulator
MKHTLLILYILITSGSLILLNKSLKETQDTLKTSFEILKHHNDVLKDHREAILIVIEKLNKLYM